MVAAEINPQNYRHVYVYGTPRGATNLFCALLHNHVNVAAISHRSSRRYLNHLLNSPQVRSFEWVFDRFDLIYEKGGPAKDFGKVTHLLFDKVHWASDQVFRHIKFTLSQILAGRSDGIVLIRHPVRVLKSMDNFHKRYGRPRWALTRFNALRYLVQYLLPQLWLLKYEELQGVVVEAFVKNLPDSYHDLCTRLKLPFEPEFADFASTFERSLTWSGRHFVVKECQVSGGGTFLTSKGIKTSRQYVYFDPINNEPTWGYGNFNPLTPLDPDRLVSSLESLENANRRLIREVFCYGISKADVDYLFETDILEVEKLREFNITGIGKLIFRLLYQLPPPRWFGNFWRCLRARPY